MKNIKHKNILFLAGVLLIISVFFYFLISRESDNAPRQDILDVKNEVSQDSLVKVENEISADIQKESPILNDPMDRVKDRISKKPFGIFVSPKKSPVSPERFSGYHTAIDLEIFPEEAGMEIQVKAVCGGEIVSKRSASGYGGLLVQACNLNGNPVTVVYGHLKLSSIEKNIGDKLEQGEKIGLLGDGYSSETDGERKHLHFGIHKGSEINILGYVQSNKVLVDWIDPCLYLCN